VLGTAAYLAPEQARGEEVSAAADVYGVGAVLYELLTGRPPRAPSSIADLATATAIQPPVEAPRALATVVMRCLALEPSARPASAADVARELAATLPEAPTLPLPEPPSQRATEIMQPRHRSRVRPTVALAAIAVGAIAGGVGAAIATTGGGSKPAPPAVTRVSPVPHAATAEQQAHNLAAWLARYSR
jgi:eukaryotic-like serine/threonine-protein kinase